MKIPHALVAILCLISFPSIAQKEDGPWKAIDCYPGLEFATKRTPGAEDNRNEKWTIKLRHHYAKTIYFSFNLKGKGSRTESSSMSITLQPGIEKVSQFTMNEPDEVTVVVTNFRLGGDSGDLIPCSATESDDTDKKKDKDEKSDDDQKKENKKDNETPVVVPVAGAAATTLLVGGGNKNEGQETEGDKQKGERTDEEKRSDENTIKEKEHTGTEDKNQKTGEKEGEQKEKEDKENKQPVTTPTEVSGAAENKTGNSGQAENEVKSGAGEEQKNPVNVTADPTENKQEKEQHEEKTEEKALTPVKEEEQPKTIETPVVVPANPTPEPEKVNPQPTPTEEPKVQEQSPANTEQQPKVQETPVVVPVNPMPEPEKVDPQPTLNEGQKPTGQNPVVPEEKKLPEPKVTPAEPAIPEKERETKVTEPVPAAEPTEEEGEAKAEETKEEPAEEVSEEEKTLPEAEGEEKKGEASEGETEEEEEEKQNEDLQRRIEEGKERQLQSDDSQQQMISQVSDILSAEGGGDVYSRLAIGMNLEGGFAVQAVPLVENASSTTGAITPYSASVLPVNLGIYARPELWLLRNQYFGFGVDYRVVITYNVIGGGGISSTAIASGGNVRFQAGLKHFKLHFQAGKENRNGTYSNDHDVTSNALGVSTTNNIYSDGDYDYQVSNTGFGALIDFKDNNDKEAFIRYTLSLERPDFLPAANASIKVHTIHVRYFLDIIFTYGNKYPIAGKPSYSYSTSDRNKDYFFFGLGKTFKIFKSK
jgi:hypothetical protein